jgi:hypothetical protein
MYCEIEYGIFLWKKISDCLIAIWDDGDPVPAKGDSPIRNKKFDTLFVCLQERVPF